MALFPTNIGFTASQLTSNEPALVEYTQSGKKNARLYGGHKWGFTVSLPILDEDDWADIYAFFLELDNSSNFTIRHPLLNTPRGIATGTPLVNGATQTGTTLITDGWTPNQTGIIKKRSIFTVAGSTKVHMITQDSNSDIGGNATLTFRPAITTAPADNAAITIQNVEFTVALAGGMPKLPLRPPKLANMSFDVIEVI